MSWKRMAVVGLAVLASHLAGQAVRADDVKAPTVTLERKANENAATQATFWHGGYGSGYYAGYGSFYRPSYYYGSSSFYQPSYYYGGYSSFYRPSFYYGSSSFYRPSYYYGGFSSSYYSPPYSYYYTPSYYSRPSFYYTPSYSYYSPYYCPISLNVRPTPSAAVPGGTYQPVPPKMDPLPPPDQGQVAPQAQPLPQGKPDDGTFPYDGGPSNPVPMPRDDAAPQNVPNKGFVPGEGRLVSLPAAPKYIYPAYGEKQK